MSDDTRGVGGDYEIRDGKRVLVKPAHEKPMPEGGGPRDSAGKPIVDKAPEKSQPALPAPAPEPWETSAPAPAAGAPRDGASGRTNK